MPSVVVNRRLPFAVQVALLLAGTVGALVWASGAWAEPLGTSIPAGCVAHTGFGEPDVPGDYRCAGIALRFFAGGADHARSTIWAGQWLFADDAGQFRVGTCTFNRGTHPTTQHRSTEVAQSFPNDPTGAKGAYLAWRYGDTADPLTAAGVWAVFHHYALDPAGTNFADDPTAPLVPRLDGLAASSGRADLQAKAIALDAEAAAFSGPWGLSVSVGADGVVTATLLAGTTPVPGRPIAVLVSGLDSSFEATTGADGNATVTVPLPLGTATVVATTDAPGPLRVYRGVPASPNPLGAQPLATAGPSNPLRVETVVDTDPATTEPATTEPVTTEPVTTEPPTTEPATTEPPTTEPDTTRAIRTPTGSAQDPPLPSTGVGGRGGVAQLATAFLVGGIGLLGTLRRRHRGEYTRPGDPR